MEAAELRWVSILFTKCDHLGLAIHSILQDNLWYSKGGLNANLNNTFYDLLFEDNLTILPFNDDCWPTDGQKPTHMPRPLVYTPSQPLSLALTYLMTLESFVELTKLFACDWLLNVTSTANVLLSFQFPTDQRMRARLCWLLKNYLWNSYEINMPPLSWLAI